MVEWNVINRLCKCFPDSFINGSGEFIAHLKANEYFILRDCETLLDVKCKVLERLSRGAYKSQPFSRKSSNDVLHLFMLRGVNNFLETEFTLEDMERIYTYLGNCCNHEKTIRFINSEYDMSILEDEEDGE